MTDHITPAHSNAASLTAAMNWRVDRLAWGNLAPCDRWYVHGGDGAGRWTACPPCYCPDEHDWKNELPSPTFYTHAEAIAYADQQARAHVLPSTPRRKS